MKRPRGIKRMVAEIIGVNNKVNNKWTDLTLEQLDIYVEEIYRARLYIIIIL
jgi:hypothetical protein